MPAQQGSSLPRERTEAIPIFDDAVTAESIKDATETAVIEAQRRRTPEAQEERAESRTSFRDASPQEALSAALTAHRDALVRDALDPDVESVGKVKRYVGDSAAIVDTPGGDSFVSSTFPLRAEDGNDGDEVKPLDLDLEARGSDLGPDNALAPTRIPRELDGEDGVSFDNSAIEITPTDADPSRARTISGKVFFADIATDTDFLVAPLPAGVELSWFLRSPASPQTLSLDVTRRDGAQVELRRAATGSIAVPGGEPSGSGVDVFVGDRRVTTVLPPAVQDAQGRVLPVTMRPDGNRIELGVRHRDLDLAYPLHLDPYVYEDQRYWGSGNANFAGWSFFSSPAGYLASQAGTLGNYGNGLHIASYANGAYANGQYGQWVYRAPGTATTAEGAYIFKADFGYTSHRPSGTCLTQGIWSNRDGRWEPGAVRRGPAVNNPLSSSPFSGCGAETFNYRVHGFNNPLPEDGGNPLAGGTPANSAVLGLVMNGTYTRAASASLSMQGALIHMFDRGQPRLSSGSSSSSWTRGPAPVSATFADFGLGMRSVSVTDDRGGSYPANTSSCSGTASSSCPQSLGGSASISTEGETAFSITGRDPIGNAETYSGVTRVDSTGPQVSYSGPLHLLRTAVPKARYDLQITARDGDAATAAQRRSGARRLVARIDGGSAILDATLDCPQGSCDLTRTVSVDAAQLSPGNHRVDVTATDQVGNTTNSSMEFTVACCSIAESPWATSASTDTLFADVTGDGAADVVERAGSAVSVRASNGTDQFAAPAQWGNVPASFDLSAADIDADQRLDLVGYDRTTGSVVAARSTSTAFESPAPFGELTPQRRVIFGDFDANETVDAAIFDPSDGQLRLAITDSNLSDSIDAGTLPIGSRIRAADVNSDAAADIVFTPADGGDVRVRLMGDDNLQEASTWASAVPAGDLALADVDRDGQDDLLVRPANGSRVEVRSSLGDRFGEARAFGTLSGGYSLGAADATGDGAADLVGRRADGTVAVAAAEIESRLEEAAGFVADASLTYDDGDSADVGQGEDDADADADGGGGGASARQAPPPPSRPAGCDVRRAPSTSRMELSWGSDAGVLNATNRQAAIQRILESGATWTRITLLRNAWLSNAPGYRSRAVDAVRDLVACGIRPHITLTGADYDYATDPADATKTLPAPSFVAIDNDDFVDEFQRFVRSAVRTLSPIGARDFSMWNEPNLARFLLDQCVPGKFTTTVKLYRDLYDAGRASALGVVRGTGRRLRIYAGEMSQVRHSAGKGVDPVTGQLVQTPGARAKSFYASCETGARKVRQLRTIEWLRGIAKYDPPGADRDELVTSGVAWHPYQARRFPRIKDKRRGTYGIGYLPEMLRALTTLSSQGDLRTGSSSSTTVPSLYLTEFGYFNQPEDPRTAAQRAMPTMPAPSDDQWRTWHTEAERRVWLRAALDFAENPTSSPTPSPSERPKTFTFWVLQETGVDQFFDTGVLGPFPTLETRGTRPYGKPFNPSNGQEAPRTWQLEGTFGPFTTTHTRSAYCEGIRGWAGARGGANGYQVTQAGSQLTAPCP